LYVATKDNKGLLGITLRGFASWEVAHPPNKEIVISSSVELLKV